MAIGLPATSGLIWTIRLEGRINMHEAVCAERYANLLRGLTESNAAKVKRFDVIEQKLDRLIGAV